MKTIYKYELSPEIALPHGAKVLSVGLDGEGAISLWAEVDTETDARETRRFIVLGTGIPMTKTEGKFIGTVTKPPFVWHVYERMFS